MSGTSAVPAWLLQILPQWFLDRPAFCEALWAGSYSAYLSFSTAVLPVILADAFSDGAFASWAATRAWLVSHWYSAIVGIWIAPLVRSRQAASKANLPEPSIPSAAQPQRGTP